MTWGEHRQLIVQGAGSGLPLSLINRALNMALEQIQAAYTWPRADKTFNVQIGAPVTTGTVAVTSGSTAVTGTGTAWSVGLNGWRFRVVGDLHHYTIAVTSSTALALDRPYEGTTASGKAFRVSQFVVPLQERTMQVKRVLSALGGPLEQSWEPDVDAIDAHREILATYPERWYPISDTTGRSPQSLELSQIAIWPDSGAFQSLTITASERVVPCSDDSTNIPLPAWLHDSVLNTGALVCLGRIAPPREDGSPRIDLKAQMVLYEAALRGMKAEADRQPLARQMRGTPLSENPCRNIF